MTKGFKFGRLMLTAISFIALSGIAGTSAFAQKPQTHPDRPPQRQQSAAPPRANTNRPPANNQAARQNNQAARPQGQQQERPATRPVERAPNRDVNRPPSAATGGAPSGVRGNNFNNRPNENRPNENRPGATLRPRQQLGVGAARPFVDRMRDLTPQQRDRVLQSSRSFENLSPEQQGRIRQQFNQWDRMTPMQRADLREKENAWRNLTPEQREHIKRDVLPTWRQLPWERQQTIQNKLRVLQNMPESARNQRLSDPNFTRGMSEEDKSTLHDLSHLHVGGPPDPPNE